MTAAVDVDEALLALKIGFLVLLYLFIWLIVRSASRDLRVAPQESMVIPAGDARVAREQLAAHGDAGARLLILSSPGLPSGGTLEITGPLSVGRGGESGLRLDDEVVSARHARFELRDGGLWVQDEGSTNGTFVNGARVATPRLLQPGDLVKIGQTELEVVA